MTKLIGSGTSGKKTAELLFPQPAISPALFFHRGVGQRVPRLRVRSARASGSKLPCPLRRGAEARAQQGFHPLLPPQPFLRRLRGALPECVLRSSRLMAF